MSTFALLLLGSAAGAGAGLLAGLIGIGGGIVIVPVVYYGLLSSGVAPDEAVHVAVATSLAAILPAAVASFFAHRRAGNTDFAFLRDWGPGIAIGVVAAQFAAPHVRGALMTAIFAVMCLVFAVRFAFPQRFHPIAEQPPGGRFRHMAAVVIGITSGFAGISGPGNAFPFHRGTSGSLWMAGSLCSRSRSGSHQTRCWRKRTSHQ
jgi:uncharacterized protein